MSEWIDTSSGAGYTPPTPPLVSERERVTSNVHTLVTPSTRAAFEVWAAKRGLKVSGGVRALIEDALWREARGEPLGALYGDLPASVARQIVANSQSPQPPAEA